MTIDDLQIIDRPAAFPIYSFETGGLSNDTCVPKDYEPGRNVLFGFVDNTTRLVDWSVEERLGSNDIVYVPLYKGENPETVVACDGTQDKLDCYEENLRFLEAIAPKVKGVLVGNAGPELSFKHLALGSNRCSRKKIIDEMCKFVDETSDIILEAGGSPVYGPVDWDIAIDAYFCDGKYKDFCNGQG